ncbi:TPA: HNH endonuclease [Staphylococcus pseudintermedius]|uniref:Putative HNH nuclease YajD n=1 Tax=Staphylococcus pseudintermedius TaxID=283734 RepID=A0A317Z657_STAPS|nr:HNH endonuclease signature motif containing protein [Staphylococcus pseudintermedius]EGQ0370168.1 HNH endonuclease [Staphylococcus pseudintermedius]EGQ1292268.1 HNH endonuclease [Staphylococcus pseudintermedius]EGQ1315210.1 HNH endonuclease [Staphylococcus pseudintermedius]EGQ1603782.1 HNH endonuclease [Staphylococcus pseudintermedius]EGQ1611193.1 HNH endonuclease [Staphylococcus pseudintermedius]
MTQREYQAQRERNRQRNAKRYNANTRYAKDSKYMMFYHSKAWRDKRKQVLLRDKYLCQSCLRKGYVNPVKNGQRFYVHHIVELKDDWEKRLDMDNLETVCSKCHIEAHRCTNKERG